MASKRKRNKMQKAIQRKNGIVYVIKFWLEGKVLYKVGATSGNPRRRVLQVIESIEQAYGEFPRCEIIEDSSCKNYYQVENKIHKLMSEYAYVTENTFSGHTELFECDEEVMREAYKKGIESDEQCDEDNTFEW